MRPEYADWIKKNVPEDCVGMCGRYANKMYETFPELQAAWGRYIEPTGREHPHWWLLDAEGNIVDPTARQFRPGGVYVTERTFKTIEEIPTGACRECGVECFNYENFCSGGCERIYLRELMG